MRFLLTSAGISNPSIHHALVNLLGKPIAESSALFILTALPSIKEEYWVSAVQATDALLVGGGDSLYLCYWMRQSGLADLLPSLRPAAVYVGLSAGSMVLAPRIGEDFVEWKPPTGDDRTLGMIDFAMFPHLAHRERAIRHLLRRALDGDPRDVLLRLQYPEGMPLPGMLGDGDALTPAEQEQLELAVARVNRATLDAHDDDPLELLVADYRAARQELLDLLRQFTDEQLAAPVPTVMGDRAAGGLFAGCAEHGTGHIAWIEEGWRLGV